MFNFKNKVLAFSICSVLFLSACDNVGENNSLNSFIQKEDGASKLEKCKTYVTNTTSLIVGVMDPLPSWMAVDTSPIAEKEIFENFKFEILNHIVSMSDKELKQYEQYAKNSETLKFILDSKYRGGRVYNPDNDISFCLAIPDSLSKKIPSYLLTDSRMRDSIGAVFVANVLRKEDHPKIKSFVKEMTDFLETEKVKRNGKS